MPRTISKLTPPSIGHPNTGSQFGSIGCAKPIEGRNDIMTIKQVKSKKECNFFIEL